MERIFFVLQCCCILETIFSSNKIHSNDPEESDPVKKVINQNNDANDNDRVTSQKMKFSIKDFFSKCDQIPRKLRIWSHLLKKSLIENFIFCAVTDRK